ncbi:MAG: class 1 fructose-bisphosphatase [Alphaproteobacteria bacterium]
MRRGRALDVPATSETAIGLDTALEPFARQSTACAAAAEAIHAILSAAIRLEALIAKGPLAGALGEEIGENTDGDRQKALDLIADDLFARALASAPVAVIGSEEQEAPAILDPAAPVAVAIDPLDGSSNVDTNISVGTIFSILPMVDDPAAAMLQPGRRQLAAGFVIYGPQTCLALTLGAGTDIYTLDRESGRFLRTREKIRIPPESSEYAINASNARHWEEPVRAYIDDNVAGAEGPRGKNFNMRWIASLVAEAYRILIRGGIFLYPGDRRPGYEEGRLRLVYEASPLAMIIEQAGGLATDGENRILDLQPKTLHQRVPLVFGSSTKVERVRAFHDGTLPGGERSPLFGRRGLFRQ